MVDQASMNSEGRLNGHGTSGIVSSLAGMGSDIATLVELQAQLTAIDIAASAARARVPAAILLSSAVLAICAIPIALLGVAELIVVYGGLRLPWALLLTAITAIAVAALVGWLAWDRFSKSFDAMRRSREELVRNLAWIKTVLAQSGRPTQRSIRS
jgi:hypothetical protein